ncbi:MAG: hypothetical protein ABIJ56_20050 [Pseudomonadota bacterium]
MERPSNKTIPILALAVLCACGGAKTDLWDPEQLFHEGDARDAAQDHHTEADFIADTPVEVADIPFEFDLVDTFDLPDFPEVTEIPDIPDPCDLPCDDGIACTEDLCDPATGCLNVPVHERCEDGIGCTDNWCDVAAGCMTAPVHERCSEGIDCTDDRCDGDAGCMHTPVHERCDDRTDCTDNWCDPGAGCVFPPVHERCNDGIDCTFDQCFPGEGCRNTPVDSRCSDGVECTLERCDTAVGACTIQPRHAMCADTIDCTDDICDPEEGCGNRPNDDRCLPGERCDPDCFGCILDVAPTGRFLAHSSSSLYQVDPGEPDTLYVGEILSANVTDIAVTPDIRLWGVTYGYLISIDYCTGEGTFVGNVGSSSLNALVGVTDDTLYGADGNGNLWRISASTGEGTFIGNYGWGIGSSGDLAYGPDGNLYASATSRAYPGQDVLLRVDPDTGVSEIVGPIGYSTVYGLAVLDDVLYGCTDSGQLITIDMATGHGTLVGSLDVGFWGAASPP